MTKTKILTLLLFMLCASCTGMNQYIEENKRANIPDRFITNGNGTVTDTKTNLMWQQYDDGIPYNWHEAAGKYEYNKNDNIAAINNPKKVNVCRSLQLGGLSNWRLPTLEELKSLMIPMSATTRMPEKSIDRKYFPTTRDRYWTSDIGWGGGSLWTVDEYGAMTIDFTGYGSINRVPAKSNNIFYVRCVHNKL